MPAPLPIESPAGWREVSPRAGAPDLLVETGGRLLRWRSDGSTVLDFGVTGPVDCPLALDAEAARAYRHVCESRLNSSDFSEIRCFDLKRGGFETVRSLGVNQWVLWMLEWLPGRPGRPGGLFGLLASDLPVAEGIRINHQLMLLDSRDWALKTRLLCRDAYYPLAFERERGEMLFAGAEGIHRVGLRGERLGSLTAALRPGGRGAVFDPEGAPRAVLGGAGLFLWDFSSGGLRRLTRLGQYPVWAPGGSTVWYSESSSNLLRHDLKSGESETVLAVRRDRHPEVSYARPARLTACGRYLGLPVTCKRVAGMVRSPAGEGRRERLYAHDHAFVIADLEAGAFWQLEGFVTQFHWLEAGD